MENVSFLKFNESINFLSTPHPLYKVDASLSPYAGCQSGCVYCPFGFEKRIGVKTDFLYNLDRKLSCAVGPAHIGLGAACEPYCAQEKEFNITRNAVELITKYEFPLQVFTKSPLALRDAGLFKEHSDKGLLAVSVSVMTLDEKITRIFEPHAAPAGERISMLKELSGKGIFSGAVLAPIIPYITDSPEQIEAVFERVSRAGGQYVLPSVLSAASPAAFDNCKAMVLEHYPNIFHRIDNIYENAKLPAPTYTQRINDLLENMSRKYDLPLYIPTEKDECLTTGIRQELLK